MPALTTTTQVQPDWVDYNGHLRDAFYLLIFSYATDALMDASAWTATTAKPAAIRCSPWNCT
jgi:acyl-CoA thioesterase FadM